MMKQYALGVALIFAAAACGDLPEAGLTAADETAETRSVGETGMISCTPCETCGEEIPPAPTDSDESDQFIGKANHPGTNQQWGNNCAYFALANANVRKRPFKWANTATKFVDAMYKCVKASGYTPGPVPLPMSTDPKRLAHWRTFLDCKLAEVEKRWGDDCGFVTVVMAQKKGWQKIIGGKSGVSTPMMGAVGTPTTAHAIEIAKISKPNASGQVRVDYFDPNAPRESRHYMVDPSGKIVGTKKLRLHFVSWEHCLRKL